MDKLNRLVWTDCFVINPYGVPFGFRSNQPEGLERLRQWVLRWGWKPLQSPPSQVLYLLSYRAARSQLPSGKKDYHLLYLNESLLHRTLQSEQLLRRVEGQLVDRIESLCPEHFVLQGKVVALPSCTGGSLWLSLGPTSELATLEGRIILDAAGYVYNAPIRQNLAGIILGEGMGALSRAQFCAELLSYSLSSLEHTAHWLQALVNQLEPDCDQPHRWRWI